MIYKIALFFTKIFINSPFYPYWLNNLKAKKLEKKMLTNLHGNILEVGAGDASKKKIILKNNPKIKKYVVTDYSSWDQELNNLNRLATNLRKIFSLLFGFQEREKLDKICDAMNLPFKDDSFDYHLSFEVLEHISNPFIFFEEASRIINSKGKIILSVPVFYRVHGIGEAQELDYFRYMPGFFINIAKINNLKLEKIYFNTGLGTTTSLMINQFLIEKIKKIHIILKPLLFLLAIIIFPLINLIGFFPDIFPDIRFSNRYFVLLKKK